MAWSIGAHQTNGWDIGAAQATTPQNQSVVAPVFAVLLGNMRNVPVVPWTRTVKVSGALTSPGVAIAPSRVDQTVNASPVAAVARAYPMDRTVDAAVSTAAATAVAPTRVDRELSVSAVSAAATAVAPTIIGPGGDLETNASPVSAVGLFWPPTIVGGTPAVVPTVTGPTVTVCRAVPGPATEYRNRPTSVQLDGAGPQKATLDLRGPNSEAWKWLP